MVELKRIRSFVLRYSQQPIVLRDGAIYWEFYDKKLYDIACGVAKERSKPQEVHFFELRWGDWWPRNLHSTLELDVKAPYVRVTHYIHGMSQFTFVARIDGSQIKSEDEGIMLEYGFRPETVVTAINKCANGGTGIHIYRVK